MDKIRYWAFETCTQENGKYLIHYLCRGGVFKSNTLDRLNSTSTETLASQTETLNSYLVTGAIYSIKNFVFLQGTPHFINSPAKLVL